jgi:hypothetical protein
MTTATAQHDSHVSAFQYFWIVSGKTAFRKGKTYCEVADRLGVPMQSAARDSFRDGFVYVASVRAMGGR